MPWRWHLRTQRKQGHSSWRRRDRCGAILANSWCWGAQYTCGYCRAKISWGWSRLVTNIYLNINYNFRIKFILLAWSSLLFKIACFFTKYENSKQFSIKRVGMKAAYAAMYKIWLKTKYSCLNVWCLWANWA